MKKLFLVLGFCGAAAFWNGCASDDASASKPKEEAPLYVWLDDTTPKSVNCTGIQVGKTVDGRLKVTAHLRNQQYYRVEVQANCVFMDAQGFTVDEAPFRTLILDENATQDVAFESFNTDAVRYLVRVRKSR